MASLTAPTTSTFARLFKQSKFSSFDPAISQVYTTFGGDAHRGHWGFKRPLPLRRRGAYITVKNVDTPEYQTEWNSAEPQALWMKNWDELKITPSRRALDDSSTDLVMDSDFVPKMDDPTQWRQSYLANVEVMTRSEFKKHLEQVRQHRDQFLSQALSGKQSDMTSYQLSNSQKSYAWHEAIDRQISQERRANPHNKAIEHMPHVSRGLSYAQYSPLQTFLMTKERKGRITDEHRGQDKYMMYYMASFAGLAGRVFRKHAAMAQPMVAEDPEKTGAVMIRPQRAVLERWPSVVGTRQGLKAARVVMDLRVWDKLSHQRSNPHPPGSREYVAAEPPRAVEQLAPLVTRGRGKRRSYSGTTFSLLKSAIQRTPTPPS